MMKSLSFGIVQPNNEDILKLYAAAIRSFMHLIVSEEGPTEMLHCNSVRHQRKFIARSAKLDAYKSLNIAVLVSIIRRPSKTVSIYLFHTSSSYLIRVLFTHIVFYFHQTGKQNLLQFY